MIDHALYVAVRRTSDSGREWPDPSTFSGAQDECRRRAGETDRAIPDWAKENPVVRIAWTRIVEVDAMRS